MITSAPREFLLLIQQRSKILKQDEHDGANAGEDHDL